MADIFISYSKARPAAAKRLAAELKGQGFSVWWDTDLVPGESYQDVILKELDQARAVIVIWTKASVKSRWVYAEAIRAESRKVLITLREGDVGPHDIPLPFNAVQTGLVSNRAALGRALAGLKLFPRTTAESSSNVQSGDQFEGEVDGENNSIKVDPPTNGVRLPPQQTTEPRSTIKQIDHAGPIRPAAGITSPRRGPVWPFVGSGVLLLLVVGHGAGFWASNLLFWMTQWIALGILLIGLGFLLPTRLPAMRVAGSVICLAGAGECLLFTVLFKNNIVGEYTDVLGALIYGGTGTMVFIPLFIPVFFFLFLLLGLRNPTSD